MKSDPISKMNTSDIAKKKPESQLKKPSNLKKKAKLSFMMNGYTDPTEGEAANTNNE